MSLSSITSNDFGFRFFIVSNAEKLGKEMGINGVWGNVGVASSALITGVITQYFGWRIAFLVPAVACLVIGFLYLQSIIAIKNPTHVKDNLPLYQGIIDFILRRKGEIKS